MIFAAGLGTRLKPITDTSPKALVPVAGKPLIEHVTRKLWSYGISEVVVNVHSFADKIEDWIADQSWITTNRDELTDDIDYYPEPYLDRLASEGINGIWLTIVWKEMAETSFFPVDPLRAQRIAKLKKTVEKCRRYGIKVWVFCIEPKSWTEDFKAPSADMQGECGFGNDMYAFCIASENSRKYIRESVSSIFRDTPNLGGMMLISLG